MYTETSGLVAASVDRSELVKHQLRDKNGRWIKMLSLVKFKDHSDNWLHGTVTGMNGQYVVVSDVADAVGGKKYPKANVHHSHVEVISSKANLGDHGTPAHETTHTSTPPAGVTEPDSYGFDKPADWQFIGELEDPNGDASFVFNTPGKNRVIARTKGSIYGATAADPFSYSFMVYGGNTDLPFDKRPSQSDHVGTSHTTDGVQVLEDKLKAGPEVAKLPDTHATHLSQSDMLQLEHELNGLQTLLENNGFDVDSPVNDDIYGVIHTLATGLSEDTPISKHELSQQIKNVRVEIRDAASEFETDSPEAAKLQATYDYLKKVDPEQSPAKEVKAHLPGSPTPTKPAAVLKDADVPETPPVTPVSKATLPPDMPQKLAAFKELLAKVGGPEPAAADTKKFEVLADPGTNGDGYYPAPGVKLWGKYGAAGVMLRHHGDDGQDRYLLVQRGPIVSTNKGKWQLPGGALNSKENDYQGTARELQEELSPPDGYLLTVKPRGESLFSHPSGWHYNNITADVPEQFTPHVDGTETGDAKWFTKDEVNQLDLHPALKGNLDQIFATYDTNDADSGGPEAGIPDTPSGPAAESTYIKMDQAASQQELGSLGFYIGDGYSEINESLRSGGAVDSQTAQQITDLRSVAEKSFVKQDTVMYRGTDLPTEMHKNLKVGMQVHDAGFVSLTSDEDVATTFLNDAPYDRAVFFEVHIPAGSQLIDVSLINSSDHSGILPKHAQLENEFILPDGAYFEIAKVTSIGGGRKHVEVDYYPGDTPQPLTVIDDGAQGATYTPDVPVTVSLSGPAAPEELAALDHYTLAGYESVNHGLRYGNTGVGPSLKTAQTTKHMQSLAQKSSLTSDAVFYRGVDDVGFTNHMDSGTIITDKGFMSASSNQSVAAQFGAVIFEIHAPAGSKVIDVDKTQNKSVNGSEKEFIFPNGSSLVVDSDTTDDNGTRHIVTHLGDSSGTASNAGDTSSTSSTSTGPSPHTGPGEPAQAPSLDGGPGNHHTPAEPVGDEGLLTEAVAENGGLVDTSTWKKLGGQLGSNPGGTYEAPDGSKHYVKQAKSEEHAKNEVLADGLYELAGIKTANLKLADVGNGKIGTESAILPNSTSNLKQKLNDPAYKQKLQDGFAMDAWLANWDVAGLVYDNVLTDEHGDPVRVDPGGALLYRAQGAPKGGAFGNSAGEWSTLRDGSNAQSKALFGDMTDAQLKASAQHVANISPDQIDAQIDKLDFDPQVTDKLKDTLKARRLDVIKRAGITEPSSTPEPPAPTVPNTPDEPSLQEPPDTAPLGPLHGFTDLTNYDTKPGADLKVINDAPPGSIWYPASGHRYVKGDDGVWVRGSTGKPATEVIVNFELSQGNVSDGVIYTPKQVPVAPAVPPVAEVPAPTPAPNVPSAGSVDPLVPYGMTGKAANGAKYVTTPDGKNVYPGTTVTSSTDGLTGMVAYVESNGTHVKVIDPATGKLKGRNLKTLTVADPATQPTVPSNAPDPVPELPSQPAPPPKLTGDFPAPDLAPWEKALLGYPAYVEDLDNAPVGSSMYTTDGHGAEFQWVKTDNNKWTWVQHTNTNADSDGFAEPLADGKVSKITPPDVAPPVPDTGTADQAAVSTALGFPAVPYGTVGTGSGGQKYVTDPNGQHITKGTTVKSSTDGLVGEVHYVENNGTHVKIKGPDGKIKGRNIKTLTVINGTTPTSQPTPTSAAPAVSKPVTAPQAQGLKVGESFSVSSLQVPSLVKSLPIGTNITDKDGDTWTKVSNKDKGLWTHSNFGQTTFVLADYYSPYTITAIPADSGGPDTADTPTLTPQSVAPGLKVGDSFNVGSSVVPDPSQLLPVGTKITDKDGDTWTKKSSVGSGKWALPTTESSGVKLGGVYGPYTVTEIPGDSGGSGVSGTPTPTPQPSIPSLKVGDAISPTLDSADTINALPAGTVVTDKDGDTWHKNGAGTWQAGSVEHDKLPYLWEPYTITEMPQGASSTLKAGATFTHTKHAGPDVTSLPAGTTVKDKDNDVWTKLDNGQWSLGNNSNAVSNLPPAWGPYTVQSVPGTSAPTAPTAPATPAVVIPGQQLVSGNGKIIKVGTKVHHPKFGEGHVTVVENNGTHAKVYMHNTGKVHGLSAYGLTVPAGDNMPKAGTKLDSSKALNAMPLGTTIETLDGKTIYKKTSTHGGWSQVFWNGTTSHGISSSIKIYNKHGGMKVTGGSDLPDTSTPSTPNAPSAPAVPIHIPEPQVTEKFTPQPVTYTAPIVNSGTDVTLGDPSSPLFGTTAPEPPTPEAAGIVPFVPAGWLDAAAIHYHAHKNTSKTIQESGYWNKVQAVMNNGSLSDLEQIKKSNLIDAELYDQAKAQFALAKASSADAATKFAAQQAAYQLQLKDWKQANGVVESNNGTPLIQVQLSDQPFEGGTPDWTKAHYGTASAVNVIAAVKTDAALAARGMSITTDGGAIENLDVRAIRVIDVDGGQKVEFKFKITAKTADKLAQTMGARGFKSSPAVKYRKRDIDPVTGLPRYLPTNKYTTSGTTYTYDDPATGMRIEFARGDAATTPNNLAVAFNTVRVYSPVETTTAESLEAALTRLGVESAAPATEHDIRMLAENKIISVLGGRSDAVKTIVSAAERQAVLDKVQQKYGIGLGDLHLQTDSLGMNKLILSDAARDKVLSYTGLKAVYHSVYQGNNIGVWESILSGPVPGVIATNRRWQEGINQSGMSSDTDMGKAGADYVFTHASNTAPSTSSYGSSNVVHMHPYAAARRLDVYANQGDAYGARKANTDVLELIKNQPHETLYRDGIPVSDMWFTRTSGDIRSQLIDRLHKKGITSINGIPLENFILSGNMPIPVPDLSQWSSAGLPPAVTV